MNLANGGKERAALGRALPFDGLALPVCRSPRLLDDGSNAGANCPRGAHRYIAPVPGRQDDAQKGAQVFGRLVDLVRGRDWRIRK